MTEYQTLLLAMLASDMSMKEIREALDRNTWVLAGTITKVYRAVGVKNRRELQRLYPPHNDEEEQ